MNALIINSTDNLSSIKLFYLSRRIGSLSSLMTYFSKFFIVSPFNGPYKIHRIKLFKLSKTSIEWNNAVHGLVFFLFPSKQRDNVLKSYLSLPVQTYVFVMNHADGRHEVLINGMPGHGYIATPHPIVHAVQKNITFRYKLKFNTFIHLWEWNLPIFVATKCIHIIIQLK